MSAVGSVTADERKLLEQLNVRDLRTQAAIRNVPLTHISAAIEKRELINLICRAKPVTDQYNVTTGVKVHDSASIAKAIREAANKPKEKKPKKKNKKKSASSSDSDSGARKKKRSRSKGKKQKRVASCSSSSGGLELVPKSRGKKPLALPPSSLEIDLSALPAKKPLKRKTLSIEDLDVVACIPEVVIEDLDKPRRKRNKPAAAESVSIELDEVDKFPKIGQVQEPTVAQVGMAAAAKLGFETLPKLVHTPLAPKPGLRPSLNPAAANTHVQGVQSIPVDSRVCMQYLQLSRCDLGANCPYAHITDPEEEMRIRSRFKLQECKEGENCQKASCVFRHPGEKVDANQRLGQVQANYKS